MAKSSTRYVRISPRKARLAASLIRGQSAKSGLEQLSHSSLRGARLLYKTLKSAIANAEHNEERDLEDLWIKDVRVDAGPTMKRSKPKNRGGRHPIMKRTSHFTIEVG